MVGFVFGSKDKDKPWSYEELQRKRAIAETLAASNLRTPQNVGEGLASIGRALMYRKLDKRAGSEEARMREEFERKWGAVLGGSGGGAYGGSGGGGTPSGTWTPDAPAPKPTEAFMGKPDVASGGLTFGLPKAGNGVADGAGGLDYGSAVMTPQEMLIAGAKARGLDPIDVATAISYETGGKFDPTIKGPTTQWGTHEGLIQFGDPQGQEHGAVFDQGPDAAWRSQLDPDSGAVWSYLDSTGVQPGMGLPEIYSAINAGAVGRMGASDANNGGAPGTVADKVASMGPHRDKAAAFLGGTWTPAEGQPVASSSGSGAPAAMGMDIGSLVSLASDPMASPAQKAIIETLIQQQLQASDPLRAMQMERERLELEALKNPSAKQPEALVERQALLSAAGVDPASPEGQQYLLTGELPEAPEAGYRTLTAEEAAQMGLPPGSYQVGPKGEIKAIGGGGTNVTVNNGGGDGAPQPEIGTIPQGYEAIWDTERNGYVMRPIPGGPEDTSGKDANKDRQGALKLGTTLTSLNLNLADIEDGGLPVTGALGDLRRTGLGQLLTGPGAVDFGNRTSQITDSAAFAEIQNMRDNSPTGGAVGNLTDPERAAIGNAVTALNNSTSADEYARAAKAYRALALDSAFGAGMWKMLPTGQVEVTRQDGGTQVVGDPIGAAPAPAPAAPAPDADGWVTLPNGVRVREVK